NVGTLARGASATLNIQATITSANPVTNVATVDADQFDPNPANNTDKAAVTPQGTDLSLVKSADHQNPNIADTITFPLTLTHNGPSDATGVVVNDPLPAGLTLQGATPSQGTYDPATGIWNVGSLANGASATLDIAVRVDDPDALDNVAAASADQFDPNPADNTD